MSDPGDEHPDEFHFIDADALVQRISAAHVDIAIEVFRRFLLKTDRLTTLETLELAAKMAPERDRTGIQPEIDAEYQFRIGLNVILEVALKEALRHGVD